MSLQILLAINMLFIGALSVVAIRHALAHFKPHQHDAEKRRPVQQNGHLPPAVKEKLLEEAQSNFHMVINRSAKELEKDLQLTNQKIYLTVVKEGVEAVSHQLAIYRERLAVLQKQSEENLAHIGKDLVSHQEELKKRLAAEIDAEKKHMVQQIDTKLADAVGSFLTETLQHNIDLGAQSDYLKKMLEEHKAEIAKEITDEA